MRLTPLPIFPTIWLILLLATSSIQAQLTPVDSIAVQPLIRIDQFGYLPDAEKIAVLSDPVVGFNSALSYSPPSVLEVRERAGGALVFSGPVEAWNAGAVHDESGDRVWWFDFSDVEGPGEYFIFDPVANRRSHPFVVGEDVYAEVLKHAVRTFYYQRSGYEKLPQHAGAWFDGASHLGPLQDSVCRSATAKGDPSTARDLSGGWFDAGDFNKYVNFCYSTLHALLSAFEENPAAFADDYNIPESGNGLPDLLDEVKWELDWLLKMQRPNGSVLSKVSVSNWEAASPPSADTAPRYYGEAAFSSTATTASIFAHAARVFRLAGNPAFMAYADTLQQRAEAAWTWTEVNPMRSSYDNAGFQSANPETDVYRQDMAKLTAAIYLFTASGFSGYNDYVRDHFDEAHLIAWNYVYGFEAPIQSALVYYAVQIGADPTAAQAIRSAYEQSVRFGNSALFEAVDQKTDAYRAPLDAYVWGSNSTKSSYGNIYGNMVHYGLHESDAMAYREAMAGYVHYLHGVNPLGIVYLSNMYDYGGEYCVDEFYHNWFRDGSAYDNVHDSPIGPPPGYVPGGPHANYSPDAAYVGPPIVPPQNQPVQKAYKQWNTSWPENSWEITENAIYYQAAYIKMLSKFVNYRASFWLDDVRVRLEGFGDLPTSSLLTEAKILPQTQPFSQAPWFYGGSESLTNIAPDYADWVLLALRDSTGAVLDETAALLLDDGSVVDVNGDRRINFLQVAVDESVYVSVHHKGHLAVITKSVRTAGQLVDFRDPAQVAGIEQLVDMGDGYALHAGDFDNNGVINNLDYNRWVFDNAAINTYLNHDVDGNGVVNNTDYNFWVVNRSKIGVAKAQYD